MEILVTGSIAYDYLMRFPGKFSDYLIDGQMHQVSLSFLVDDMTKHWGGTAANIAYTMALLGMRPKLMGTVGRDFPDYRAWLESVGVDCSTVRQIDDVFTASFFCNTDMVNNQIASFYTGAMAYARHYRIADVFNGKPDLVLITPNDPVAMTQIAQECRENDIRFVYDPSQQVPRLSGEELARDMQGAYVMVVNAYEAEVIGQKTGKSLDELRQMVEILVVTHGPRGSVAYHGDEEVRIDAFPTDAMKDPTGGGDAFRAGLIYGLMNGYSTKIAMQMGSLSATYAIEHVGTQSHRFTPAEFITRFRTHYDDNGLLDRLLARV
jgi:adenosine kinase